MNRLNSKKIKQRPVSSVRKENGFTLIELMVALTIGAFLTIASAYVLQFAQRNYITNDGIARLQEQARFALNTIENDIRLTNYWGIHNQKSAILNPATATLATIANVANDCAGNWSHNLSSSIYGTNDDTDSPAWAGTGCIANDNIVDNTDTLVVYHADPNLVTTLEAGNVYIISNEFPQSRLFTGTTAPNLGVRSQTFKLSANGYYVRPYSFSPGDNIPMLRRKTLADGGANPAVLDLEISPGVEDMQIQFGIAAPTLETETSVLSIDRYVEPGDAIFANVIPPKILSVRVWLLMRSEEPEQGFSDTSTYEYATKIGSDKFDPTGDAEKYRRLLVTKTIQLRNQVR